MNKTGTIIKGSKIPDVDIENCTKVINAFEEVFADELSDSKIKANKHIRSIKILFSESFILFPFSALSRQSVLESKDSYISTQTHFV